MEQTVKRHGKIKRRKFENFLLGLLALMFVGVLAANIYYTFEADESVTLNNAQMELDLVASRFLAKLAESETLAVNIVLDVEQLAESNATDEEVQAYLDYKSAEVIRETEGCCFNIYSGDLDGIISSPLPFPEGFQPVTRGWYQGAVANNGEMYQTPIYVDAVTGDLCYTFSSQLYDRDTVVGVDFNLNWVSNTIAQMRNSIEGFALIVTPEGQVIGCSDDSLVGTECEETLPEYYEIINEMMLYGDSNMEYMVDGEKRTVFFSETGEFCYLVLSVRADTLNSATYKHLMTVTLLSLIIFVSLIALYLFATHKSGEAHLANARAEGLSQKAYVDALTGARNKGAFNEYTERYEGGDKTFAVVMFDVNYLKRTNDTYGHEKGDIYLKKAVGLINEIFGNELVFRVGGDEFIAVLDGDDTGKIDGMFEKMDARAAEINAAAENPWEKVDMAKGYSVYHPGDDCGTDSPVEYTYKKADEAMYVDKAEKRR